jgi:hypothetical protein
MNIAKYTKKLKDLSFHEVTIGYTTIYIFAETELSEGQKGYSVDPIGKSLIGEKDGDWKNSWLVIGFEELCGDPIFVDLDLEHLPVFTAGHGIGSWNESLIADSFESFIKSIEFLAESKSKEDTLGKIRSLNQKADLEFWESLFAED